MSNQPVYINAIDAEELEAARWFLEYDLRDSADEQREPFFAVDDPKLALLRDAAADRLEELADAVADLSPEVLAEYAKALRIEKECSNGSDFLHCSMTMEIGFALDPQNIDDVCRIYARAVECIRHTPFAERGDSANFWAEFAATART
jgi:hypothetical protein